MNKIISFTIFIILIILLFLIGKPSGHNQELERKELIYKHKLDSIEKVLTDSIHKRELFYLKHYNEAMKKLDRLEGEANHWRNKYDKEIKYRRSFTDNQLDSLLARVK